MSQSLGDTLSRHVSNLFGDDSERCIYILANPKSKENLFKQILDSKNNTVVQVDLSKIESINAISKLLKKDSFCVATFYHGENLAMLRTLVSMTQTVDNNVIVYAGKQRPNEGILLKLNRPLIWAQPHQEKVELIDKITCSHMNCFTISFYRSILMCKAFVLKWASQSCQVLYMSVLAM